MICKTCHFHLSNICKITSYLDRESNEEIIHAFVTTNLNYCNAIMLYGYMDYLKLNLNKKQLSYKKKQLVSHFLSGTIQNN